MSKRSVGSLSCACLVATRSSWLRRGNPRQNRERSISPCLAREEILLSFTMPKISHPPINCGWPHHVLPPTKIWIVFRLVSQSAITANHGCPAFLRLSTQYCLMLLIRAYVLLICQFPSAAARTTFVFGPSSEWGPGTSGTSPRMRTLEFVSRALATGGRRLIRTLGKKLPSCLEIGS